MLASIYLEEHEYLTNEPQTINFGGRYLYSFIKYDDATLIVRITVNPKYVDNFFNVSKSKCKVENLSAIVGENGVGKSSFLDLIRGGFINNKYVLPYGNSTLFFEEENEVKVLSSNKNIYLAIETEESKTDADILLDFVFFYILKEENSTKFKKLRSIEKSYNSIYFSPHLDLKYNNDFIEVDKYDISLDQFIKKDLENLESKGTTENGWKFPLHVELLFKNSMRQIEFMNSSVFKDNSVFRSVFNLPYYEYGLLHFRDIIIPQNLHNTPSHLQPVITNILEKVESENSNWHLIKKFDRDTRKVLNQVEVNRYLLERFVIKAFISVVINQMEKENTWLEEGTIENPYDMKRFEDFSAMDLLYHFIKESFIEKADIKKPIFDYKEIIAFFDKIRSIISKETDENKIKKQSILLNLNDLEKVIHLHKKIVLNLLHYYPSKEGLIDEGDYSDGFISFRPTDKNLSSGENALLNFFSKLYDFIQSKLIEDSKLLPDKDCYVLLLDEADLGFHPIWKKRYISAILNTLPYFFDSLKTTPELQIIITTHDPLTLSDLPNNNVIFLQKDGDFCSVITNGNSSKIKKTFGANISDLLAHSFFVDEGLIGDFSKSKINEIIKWINRNKESSPSKLMNLKFMEELSHYKKLISLIDEKVVKLKLTEMITDLVPDNDYYNQIIEEEIRYLRNKKK